MSKPGSWIKNHPMETALIGATAGLGGAGLAGTGPFASLLGGTAGLQAAASADPAFLGGTTSLVSGESVSPFASLKSAAGVAKARLGGAEGIGKGLLMASQLAQPQQPVPMGQMPNRNMAPVNTNTMPGPTSMRTPGLLSDLGGQAPLDPNDPDFLRKLWMQRQGGVA